MYEQPEVHEVDWTPPANPDRPIKVGWAPRLHDGNSTATGTVRCTLCSWAFFGPIYEGMVQHKAHRAEHHPNLAAVSTRSKGQKQRKPSAIKAAVTARDERRARELAAMEARLLEGPCDSTELAAVSGLTQLAATTTLTWAAKKGTTTCVFNPGHGLWSLHPLPPDPRLPAIVEALQTGPKTSAELAAIAATSPVSVGTMLSAAVKRGEVAAHRERFNGKSRWMLDEGEVESPKVEESKPPHDG